MMKDVFLMPHVYPYYREPERFIEENTITLIYKIMERWEKIDGEWDIRWAPVDSDVYQTWMAEVNENIPPHITFGGAVEAGPGDPTFYDRWKQRTIAHVNNGTLQ